MQELNINEIEEVSGGKIWYYIGYYMAEFVQWSRMAQDEVVWVN